MDVILQCKKCKQYYSDGETCPRCDVEKQYNRYIEEICFKFDFETNKFSNFFYSNFKDSIPRFAKIQYETRGYHYKIVLAVFYVYANMNDIMIRRRELNGLMWDHNISPIKFEKYIELTSKIIVEMNHKNFSPEKIKREYHIRNCVKIMLGRIQKLSFENHVMDMYKLIGFDNEWSNPYLIAGLYIKHYFNVLRGIDFPYKKIIYSNSEVSYRSLYTFYYTIFLPIAKEVLLEDAEFIRKEKESLYTIKGLV